MTAKKQRSNNNGAVLLTVLTVACFAAILLTAVLSFVGRAHTNAYNNYNSEQAYYIASSALGSIHDYFEEVNTDGSYAILRAMADDNSHNGSRGTLKLSDGTTTYDIDSVIPGGDCKVVVERIGDDYIKVSVTGYCLGQAETINAYYSVMTNTDPTDIDNVLYCNGSSDFGQSAGSTGSLTTRANYKVTNKASGYGSIVAGGDMEIATQYEWKNDPSAQTGGSYITVGHNFSITAGYAHLYPTNPKINDNTSQYLAVGGRFNPQIEMTVGTGAVGGSNANEMDVYCSNALFNNNTQYTQYGNFYCYKLSDDEWDEVHAHANGETCTLTKADNGNVAFDHLVYCVINGDAFIEGNISLSANNPNKVIINGTLYISDTTDIVVANDPQKPFILCDAISCPGPLSETKIYDLINYKHLRIKKPNPAFTEDPTTTYSENDNYFTVAELMAMDPTERAKYIKSDPIVKGAATSRNTKPSTKFEDFERVYPPTEDFITQDPNIANALLLADTNVIKDNKDESVYAADYQDDDLGLKFDYVIDGTYGNSCSIQGSLNTKNILIDMNQINSNCGTDKPFVIKLKSDSWSNSLWFNNTCNIIIKNGEFNESQKKWTKEPANFCYFITEDSASGINVGAMSLTVMDYYSYKYIVKQNYGINLTSYYQNKNTSNPTLANDIFATSGYMFGTQDCGLYTPRPSRTYFMLRENDTFSPANTPAGFLEFILYAPKSKINFGGLQGNKQLKFYKGNQDDAGNEKLENLSLKEDAVLSVLGAIICDQFVGHETFGVGFVSPAPGSGVASGGGGITEKVAFDHYESR